MYHRVPIDQFEVQLSLKSQILWRLKKSFVLKDIKGTEILLGLNYVFQFLGGILVKERSVVYDMIHHNLLILHDR